MLSSLGSILKINFALSKLPHLHRAYLVSVHRVLTTTVLTVSLWLCMPSYCQIPIFHENSAKFLENLSLKIQLQLQWKAWPIDPPLFYSEHCCWYCWVLNIGFLTLKRTRVSLKIYTKGANCYILTLYPLKKICFLGADFLDFWKMILWKKSIIE